MNYDIVHNAALSRFETTVEGNLCVIDYRREDEAVYLTHVGVPRPVENRGIAGFLTQSALDWTRASGLQAVAICPYVVAWINRHPEYQC